VGNTFMFRCRCPSLLFMAKQPAMLTIQMHMSMQPFVISAHCALCALHFRSPFQEVSKASHGSYACGLLLCPLYHHQPALGVFCSTCLFIRTSFGTCNHRRAPSGGNIYHCILALCMFQKPLCQCTTETLSNSTSPLIFLCR